MSRSLLDSPEQIRKRTLKALIALALLGASCLSAQSGVTIIANVPFDFVASYRDFPPALPGSGAPNVTGVSGDRSYPRKIAPGG